MTPLWTSAEIAAATGGVASGDFACTGVTFDTREVIGGELFVALKGAASDGHLFLDQASQRGAAGALVSAPAAMSHVRVGDTMAGLTALAGAARDRAAATRIGVTGSVGKTGVKEAIRRALGRYAPDAVHWSVKSYNNHTGVPLSLARMPRETRFGVFEMGMNHAGEIAGLTRLVRPHIAVITWVASAHIENFPTGEAGIADAKGEIFQGLEPGGTAILPYDNPHRDRLIGHARPHAGRILTFGGEGADVVAERVLLQPDFSTVTARIGGERLTYKVGLAGRHWVSNSLAVLAAVHAAGADLALAGLALAELTDLPGRGERFRVTLPGGAAVIIDESYNANPASMAASLAVLGDMRPPEPGRRIAVLGDMKELGPETAQFHAGLADMVVAAGVDALILVGNAMKALASALPPRLDVRHVAQAAEALPELDRILRAGDVVLVKGSNSVGLGQIAAALKARGEAA